MQPRTSAILLAIALALLTRQVLVSLVLGGWFGCLLLTGWRPLAALLRMGPVARYDGRLSLAQAWTPDEVSRLAAGLPVVELETRFPFRLSLVLEPAGAADAPERG